MTYNFKANALLLLLGVLASCSGISTKEQYRLTSGQTAEIGPELVLVDATQMNAQFVSAENAVFSPDGTRVLVSGTPGKAMIWSAGKDPLYLIFEDQSDVTAAAWSHDGKVLATCSSSLSGATASTSLRLWDTATGHEIRSVEQYYGLGDKLAAFSDDDSLVAWVEQALSGSALLRVMSLATGDLATGDCPLGTTYFREGLAFSHQNRQLYTYNCSWDLELSPLKLTNRRTFNEYPIYAYSPDRRFGYAVMALYRNEGLGKSNRDNAIYRIDLETGRADIRWTFATDASATVHSMAISSDGNQMALATDHGICVIDLVARLQIGWLVPITDPRAARDVSTVSFSPDGRRIAGGNFLGAYIWNVLENEKTKTGLPSPR